MPGAYAHITLVNQLSLAERLEAINGFPTRAISALLSWFPYCELGAVSPDYPYLAVDDGDEADWADSMHYTCTGQMIQAGIKLVSAMYGTKQDKCLAWLLGYSAHVATDVTIHPTVELKVGPYKGNEKHHRICEMHQDAFIFPRLNLGGLGLSDYLKNNGISTCCDPSDEDKIDPDIAELWREMMREVHAEDFTKNPPEIDKWHDRFNLIVEEIASASNHLISFFRDFAAEEGICYPSFDQIDNQYIDGLAVPGGTMNYSEIFEKAIHSVERMWLLVATGVLSGDETYLLQIGDWNLDTGRDKKGQLVYWGQP